MPKEYKGTHKADFWHGEMMLHEDGDNIGQWIEAGMDTLERQNDIRLYISLLKSWARNALVLLTI